jgi:hypothetical protein
MGKRLIVLGSMGRIPFAGMAWEVLHYVEGFRRLGHDVYYIEDTNCWPYDPDQETSAEDCGCAVNYIARTMRWAGLTDRWAYRAAEPDGRVYGLSQSRFSQVFQQADALINLGASTRLRDEHLAVPVRILLQTDPGGDEILVAKGDQDTIAMFNTHTHFVNWAENLGSPDCLLPAGGFPYLTTRMPMILDWFTPSPIVASNGAGSHRLRITTVGNWRQPGEIEWNGEVYAWSKHHQFLKFIDLPRRIGEPVELALGEADMESIQLLTARGWRVVDPSPFGADILAFRNYIYGSDGEFTVAKDQYVRLRTGWFSDRSASYLAAGKPVITQDTGFRAFLPAGEGLFGFNTMEDIVTAFEAIRSDYRRHSRAARAIAEECFRSETVLAKLLDDLGL